MVARMIWLVPLLLTGCASLQDYEDMRHRAEQAEARAHQAEQFVAGCQDDNGMLQGVVIERENEIRRWQAGSMLQAIREAELRRACDI